MQCPNKNMLKAEKTDNTQIKKQNNHEWRKISLPSRIRSHITYARNHIVASEPTSTLVL